MSAAVQGLEQQQGTDKESGTAAGCRLPEEVSTGPGTAQKRKGEPLGVARTLARPASARAAWVFDGSTKSAVFWRPRRRKGNWANSKGWAAGTVEGGGGGRGRGGHEHGQQWAGLQGEGS